jgi:hypothetical protein
MYELHHIIQVVMGWTNSHLFPFNVGEQVIADTRLMDDELGPVTDVKVYSPQLQLQQVRRGNRVYKRKVEIWRREELSTVPIDGGGF